MTGVTAVTTVTERQQYIGHQQLQRHSDSMGQCQQGFGSKKFDLIEIFRPIFLIPYSLVFTFQIWIGRRCLSISRWSHLSSSSSERLASIHSFHSWVSGPDDLSILSNENLLPAFSLHNRSPFPPHIIPSISSHRTIHSSSQSNSIILSHPTLVILWPLFEVETLKQPSGLHHTIYYMASISTRSSSYFDLLTTTVLHQTTASIHNFK